MASRLQILTLLSVIVLSVSEGALAASRLIEAKTSDFLIKKWTTEEGLPQNTVTSIVQTSDGYIWLGTFGGLARFDGVNFTVFDSTNTPGLTGNRVLSLYEDRWKRLWIGTETGEVYTLVDGKFGEFKSDPEFKRRTVWQFIEDDTGKLFIASDAGLERVEFREDGSVIPESIKIISRQRSYKLAKGPGNTIWTSNGKAFVLQDDQLVTADSVGQMLPFNILKIDFSDQGRMLVGTINSLGWMDNGKFKELLQKEKGGNFGGYAAAFRNGELWFQKGEDLFIFQDGKRENYNIREHVTAGSRAMLFDNEDNLWLATESDGLVRLTKRKIGLVGDMTDLNVWGRYALAQDSEGAVWLAGHDLLKVKDGKVESIPIPGNVAGTQLIKALAIDGNNVLWAGGLTNLYVFRDGRLEPIPKFGTESIHSLFFDRNNNLWIGSGNGLWKYNNGQIEHYSTDNGLVGNSVHFITQTKDDAIWVGAIGGVSKFVNGRFENITPENGLSGNYVREILEDQDGTIWIGTYGGGINRLRDGKIEVVTTAQGLHDNFVSRILVDDDGKFWILGNLGIFAVSRDELNAVADKRKNSIVGAIYGVSDGMKSSEASGGHQSAGIKTRDGRLWFPMIKDVVIIDPTKTNLTPPKVVIEGVSTRLDDIGSMPIAATIRENNSVSIPTGNRDLEIRFTGLSFTKPENIRFFYKIDGLDDDWTDAGTQRIASYPFLSRFAPGKYTFHVRAVSASGVWSENTAILSIDVAKYFWQTWWFNVAAALFLVMVAVVLYRFKMQQVEAEKLKEAEFSRQLLVAHEIERSRIATELHDGLGQDLLIIKNWAQQGLESNSDPDEVQKRLKQISESAADALEEARTIVKNLSPQNLKRFGLTEAVRNLIEQTQMATGVVFEQGIDEIDGIFPEEAEISVYRIVQECLSNIIKHSESPRGKILVTRQDGLLTMMIQDFGKGFSRKHPSEKNSASGFGLEGISQRVKLLRGDLTIDSVVSEGTKIVIQLRF